MELKNGSIISLLFILTIVFSILSGCTHPPDSEYIVFPNIIYQEVPDIDDTLVSLDLYIPQITQAVLRDPVSEHMNHQSTIQRLKNIQGSLGSSNSGRPVMIWVHGGGWRTGDKAYHLEYKIPYFINEGWIFISVNYRLSPYDLPNDPDDLDPDRIKYPVHSQDVSAAIAWVHEHIDEYGGDPENISIMGHSAGANIVATIATNQSFLNVYGLSNGFLKNIICLDTTAYDIRERCETKGMLYLNAFGTDPAVWDDASPMNNIEEDEHLPSFFVVIRGAETRIDQNRQFVEMINQTNTRTQLVLALGYDHSEVNLAIGDPDDDIITPELSKFLGFNGSETYFRQVYVQQGDKQKSSAVVDLNSDGFLDIAIASSNNIYLIRNNGDETFTTVTSMNSTSATGWGIHDFNADGVLDLYLAQTETSDCMINNGDMTFTYMEMGNEGEGVVRTALYADFNNDGWTDSYLSTSAFNMYHSWNQLHPGLPKEGFGEDIIDTILQPPIPDFFHKYADAPGGAQGEWSNKQFKGAVVRDFDHDGYPDIVSCAYADRGYQDSRCVSWAQNWVEQQQRGIFYLRNIGSSGMILFEEIGIQAFGPDSQGNTSEYWNPYTAIPIDYDRDGDLDLFVGAVLRSSGDGTFEDTTAVRFYKNICEQENVEFVDMTDEAGFGVFNTVSVEERGYVSFAAGAPIDYDNDGWVDLILINRRDTDKTPYAYVHIYHNNGDGSFTEIDPSIHGLTGGGGRDLSYGDFNNDGTIDLVINDGTAGGYEGADNSRIYLNTINNNNHWVQLKIIDDTTQTYATGAKVSVYDSETDTLLGYDEVRADFSYRSKRTPILHFGVGESTTVDVRIEKQNKQIYTFDKIDVDELLVLSI
jgi:arylformamidase